MSFVYDNTALPTKATLNAVPGGADVSKYWRAEDANAFRSATYDVRSAILAGKLHGFESSVEQPSAAGAEKFLWLRSSDEHLIFYDGSDDWDLSQVVRDRMFAVSDAGQGTVLTALTLRRTTSHIAHAIAGIGVALLLQAEDDAGNVQDAGEVAAVLGMPDEGSELGYIRLRAMNGSGAFGEAARLWGNQRIGVNVTTEPSGYVHVVRSANVPALYLDQGDRSGEKLIDVVGMGANSTGLAFAYGTGSYDLAHDTYAVRATGRPARFQVGGSIGSSPAYRFEMSSVTDKVVMSVEGLAGHSVNLHDWKVDGSVKASVDKDGGLLTAARLQTAKAADVASASTLTLGLGNYASVTGTTTINHVTTTGWQAGSVIVLRFDDTITVTHNAGSPPVNTAALLLAGSVNFSADTDHVLALIFDGTFWREFARTVA